MQLKRTKRVRTYANKVSRGERPLLYSAEYHDWRRAIGTRGEAAAAAAHSNRWGHHLDKPRPTYR